MTHGNQTVLITGASSGIGAAIARKFAKQGFELLLLGRDEARLKAVQADCKAVPAEILPLDLRQLPQNRQLIEEKLAALAPPSILINNAGIFHQGLLEESGDDIWTQQFEVNLLAAVQLTRLLWPVFKKNRKGSVLNISSTLGSKPTAHTGAYSAMKAAMINWTQSLALEGGPYNIRANCICPGIIDTPIHSFHALPAEQKLAATTQMLSYQLLNQLGQPQDVAEAAFFLASEHSRWTTGASLNVDGGINIK